MFFLDSLKKLGKKPVRAKYDAAQRTSRNRSQWKGVDFLNADQSMSPHVRKLLRARARYEAANNPWLQGMIHQIATDMIGTGAKLQLHGMDDEVANAIEQEFSAWADEVELFKILRTAVQTEIRDGEAFIQLLSNPAVSGTSKLFPLLIDAERVCCPLTGIDTDTDNQVDGIYLDKFQQPVRYSVAVNHPAAGIDDRHVSVAAEYMCHLFREEQPEQHRGIPEITSALPSIQMLRAYTIAMLNKMEIASSISGVLKPSSAELEVQELDEKPFTEFDLPARSWVTLPVGYDAQQFNLQTPTDSQSNFAQVVKQETARCILCPKNVVLGDSSSYNYSSARMDTQTYEKSLRVRRIDIEHGVLKKVFRQWWAEAYPLEDMPRCSWYWSKREYINPVQETQSEANRMTNGNATYQELCSEQGKDWQLVMRQRFEAEEYRRKLVRQYGFDMDLGPAFHRSQEQEVTNDQENQ